MSDKILKQHILIIDDDESICRTMQMIFNAYGYKTKYAHSGKEALELFENEEFSLAIIDVRLPDIIGTELIHRLTELSPNLPVIMITGYASIETAVSAMTLGASAYITKPLDMNEVLQTVSNTLERQMLILEKQIAEDALKESEIWFRNIFNDSPVAINVFDINGNFVNANQASLTFAGVLDLHDFSGYNIFDDYDLTSEMKSTLQQGERVLLTLSIDFKKVKERNLYRTTRFDIAHVEILISPLKFGAKDSIQGYLAQIIDITVRKSAEKAVIAERDKAQLYLNTSGAIFVALDNDAKIILLNQYGSEILEIPEGEALGKDWFSNFIPERSREEVRQVFSELVTESKERHFEYDNPILTTSGTERIIHWNNTLLKDDDGKIVGILSSGIDITERKQIEDALYLSEEKFRRAFLESPIGIQILDSSGRIIEINPAAMMMFGVTDIEQLIGFDVFEDPNTPEIAKERIRQRKQYRYESAFNFELVKKNNLYDSSRVGVMFLDTVYTPLSSHNEKFSSGTMVQFQDVTNNRIAEQNLRESEERWRSYTQESPDHITIIDSNFTIQFSNRPTEGLTLEKLIGSSILDFLPDDEKEDVRSVLTEIIQAGNSSTYYTTYNLPDGRPIYYETRAIPRTINNKIVGVLLSSRDITDRRRAEERIQYQANLLQNISDAVISTDMNFKIVSWNNAAVYMYGWNTKEAIGQNIIQMLPNDYLEITRDEVDKEFNETGIWNGQIIQERKDGIKLNVLSSMSYLRDTTGKRVGIVYVNRDISDLIESQRNMLAERDRAMLYLDLMGHDIRNKLQGITIGLEIIETNIKDDEMFSIFLDIQVAAEQCSRIISTVKRTEHLTDIILEPRNLNQVVQECIEDIFGNSSETAIDVATTANGAQILADQFLNDLISSLLENAVRHNNQENKKVWINIHTNSDSVVLSIADNGPGISDERKRDLFDKTRRYGGVGLHQVKQIADKYGAKVEVKDRVSGVYSDGVKFEVWFPSHSSKGNEHNKGGK